MGSCSIRRAGNSGTSASRRPASSALHNDEPTSSASTIAVSSSAAVVAVVVVIGWSLPASRPGSEHFPAEARIRPLRRYGNGHRRRWTQLVQQRRQLVLRARPLFVADNDDGLV